jgi:hypothetical protein
MTALRSTLARLLACTPGPSVTGEAPLSERRIEPEVLANPEARDEGGMDGVCDVHDPGLSTSGAVTARQTVGLEPLGVRKAGIDECLPEVGPVSDLELMETAGAAARIEDREQDRTGRVRHVPEPEPALAGRGRSVRKTSHTWWPTAPMSCKSRGLARARSAWPSCGPKPKGKTSKSLLFRAGHIMTFEPLLESIAWAWYAQQQCTRRSRRS